MMGDPKCHRCGDTWQLCPTVLCLPCIFALGRIEAALRTLSEHEDPAAGWEAIVLRRAIQSAIWG